MTNIVEKFPGIYLIDGHLFVKNTVKGFSPFDEKIVKIDNDEYVTWDPNRSKLSAAVVKGINIMPIKKGSKILYCGIAHGYTASKLACIIGETGVIYGVEFSDRCFKELLPICDVYNNIAPICADARLPEEYSWIEKVDVVYCDIAQPDLTEIAIRNCRSYLKKGGFLMLAIKTQSIDITKSSKQVVQEDIEKLRKEQFEIIDWKMLDPFEAKHGFVVAKMK